MPATFGAVVGNDIETARRIATVNYARCGRTLEGRGNSEGSNSVQFWIVTPSDSESSALADFRMLLAPCCLLPRVLILAADDR
jgi:hypothetical protein